MKAAWLLFQLLVLRRKTFKLGDRRADIVPLPLYTSPALLLAKGYYRGYRVAQRSELELLLKEWSWPSWVRSVHALGAPEAERSAFGFTVEVVAITREKKIERAEQNLVWGMPPGTLFLFIKE